MAEFTGERVIPGQVDPDLLNEHLARYAFAARLARGKRVLDAGCGTGYGSAELAKAALSVLGADRSADAIQFARDQYRLPNLRFEQASVTALPHADASFDLVVAFEVIEHLKNWREFLVEVRRVLLPAGQFIVSTPNKLYYAESRRTSGPNPFHEHEFEYAEFHNELLEVFPEITLFVENHVEGVVFQPVEPGPVAEVRVDGGEAAPADSHFFVAVCAHRPQTGNPTFVYVPSAANVLRERQLHIDLLEAELSTKNEWLEASKRQLAELHAAHQRQTADLEESNLWASELDGRLLESGRRVVELQEQLAEAQSRAQAVVERLEAEKREMAEWAHRIEDEKSHCAAVLEEARKTVQERTEWAQRLDREVEQLKGQLALVRASRWVRMGRAVGFGPDLAD